MRVTSTNTAVNPPTRRPGFTLVELLTVMVIISILLSVAAVGIARIDRGQKTTTSVTLIEALCSEARAIAIGEGTRTRVLIHNDLADTDSPNRYLRYFAIAAEEKNELGEALESWRITSRGTLLSDGVYFDHELSRQASSQISSANPTQGQDFSGFGEWKEGRIDFPGLPKAEQDCYYYEFNPEGICVHENSRNPGGVIILSEGYAGGPGQKPILNKTNKVGFVIWRNGSTSLYRDIPSLTQGQ